MPKLPYTLDRMAEAELNLQAEEALDANAIWYYTRVMCQLALPSSRFDGNEFTRDSGTHHLVVQAPKIFSVPWGIYPRGILNWLVTEIVNPRRPHPAPRTIELGTSLAAFLEKVTGVQSVSGGQYGNIRSFKTQLTSLLASRIFFWIDRKDEEGREGMQFRSMELASAGHLMWHPMILDQPGLLQSTIEVGEKFWEDCLEHKVPVDLRIIRGLWPNCMAFDVYTWLTYKAYTQLNVHHRAAIDISWSMLRAQFGSQFKDEKSFRQKFRDALRRVRRLYSGFEVNEREGKGFTFRFSRPSVLSFPVSSPGSSRLKPRLPQDSTHK